ncbi:MAG: hypothetical protein ACRCZF_01925 [Gemmataceae bacterium]
MPDYDDDDRDNRDRDDRPRRRDDDRDDDDDRDRPRRRGMGIAGAKAAIKGPAIGLIVTSILCLFYMAYNGYMIATDGFAIQFKKQKEDFAKQNPNISPELKKANDDFVDSIANGVMLTAIPSTILATIGSFIVLIGSFKMMSLQSRGLSMTAAILSMIPCFTSCGCLLGLIFGIWAITVMNKPDVKAAFKAVANGRDSIED